MTDDPESARRPGTPDTRTVIGSPSIRHVGSPRAHVRQVDADAVLAWTPRHGRHLRLLVRVRTCDRQPDDRNPAVTVVLGEMADPAGLGIARSGDATRTGHGVPADFAEMASAIRDQILPAATVPSSVRWFDHHTDPATGTGPATEAYTRVRLIWDPLSRYLPPAPEDIQPLTGHEGRDLEFRCNLHPIAPGPDGPATR